jgi:hypothetical protein
MNFGGAGTNIARPIPRETNNAINKITIVLIFI